MSLRICFGALVITLTFVASVGRLASAAQNFVLNPSIARTGNDSDFDGQWDTSEPGCCLAYNGLPSTYNYRSAIEFDLSSIPSDASVQNAVFHIQYNGASGSPGNTLQFNQYVGNGLSDFSDFEQIHQIGPLRNSFGPGDGTLWYKVPVGPMVQSFLNQGHQYLGIMIQNVEWNQTALLSPYLAVTYIPEPTAAGLAGMAASAALLPRRRRKASIG